MRSQCFGYTINCEYLQGRMRVIIIGGGGSIGDVGFQRTW